MLYLYHLQAGEKSVSLEGDMHRYIFKVRRHKLGDKISLRHLKDESIYHYSIDSIDKKRLVLSLKTEEILSIKASHSLHIAWCIIEPKNIEKSLVSLNEMGVDKITFIYCSRSQKSFKIDIQRLEKILISSSQQSGRSQLMKLEIMENLKNFIEKYPQSKMLNFSKNTIDSTIKSIVIGCEGGFSPEEIALFDAKDIVGFDTPLVLKSQSAVSAVSAKILL
jgi:16S rRNA (uracil1498-N3)-methyltransferase